MPGTQSIVGIQSGLDTTALVEAMIKAERGNAVLLEEQQAEATNIITALKAAQAKFLALTTQLGKLRAGNTFEQATLNVSDDTYLSATGVGRIATGAYDIQVNALARNHQLASRGFEDQWETTFGTGDLKIKLGTGIEEAVTIDSGNNSLLGIRDAINETDMGVTATIINDGSSANPYRLILSSDSTGRANTISFTSELTGGDDIDFATASFDDPETLAMADGSTSVVSLHANAAYTGSTNKLYTFTVAGSGEQTVGTDIITIDWTDGTNSGSIEVTGADSEVALSGDGADGLSLSFAAGTLTAGDQFQVGTFAPLLQEAQDARISLGSAGGSGSPIVVTSANNTFSEVIGGVQLQVKKITAAGESIRVNSELDITQIQSDIKSFIDKYNDIMDFIDEQNTYNQDTGESGVLFGDAILYTMQSTLRGLVTQRVAGLNSDYQQLYDIGIRTQADGTLKLADSSRLEAALRDDLDGVIELFGDSGQSSSNLVEFISLSSDSAVGEAFEVDITQAATAGTLEGTALNDPADTAIVLDSTNSRLKLKVNGRESETMMLSQGTYDTAQELVAEIQARLDADDKIGSAGVVVEWIDNGDGTGFLRFTSGGYGSGSEIEIDTTQTDAAFTVLGLVNGTSTAGLNVAGTINGEEAEGSGQYLSGKDGNATTDGVRLKVTFDQSQVTSGAEATVTLVRGLATQLNDAVRSFTRASDGTFDRRIAGYEKQVEQYADRITAIDERLEIRRETLLQQFYEMEVALGQLEAEKQYLDNQLASLDANWMLGRRKK